MYSTLLKEDKKENKLMTITIKIITISPKRIFLLFFASMSVLPFLFLLFIYFRILFRFCRFFLLFFWLDVVCCSRNRKFFIIVFYIIFIWWYICIHVIRKKVPTFFLLISLVETTHWRNYRFRLFEITLRWL